MGIYIKKGVSSRHTQFSTNLKLTLYLKLTTEPFKLTTKPKLLTTIT